ncbi:MFS transporter [Acetobacteraceae bacterium ESL0709]|nr:MFS transporter [Acetobacteraceae bacterium ESL0697]MDF7677996.1 MFS transporter [Acetobacteraceae bacterium ESL0709]
MTETMLHNSANPARDIPPPEHPHNAWESFLFKIGIPPALFWGFVGLLIFMSGDGAESGYLASYLVNHGQEEHNVALLFTVYGISAAISSWLSGALSDVWGPRRVMIAGLIIWIVLQIGFLGMAIPSNSFSLMVLFYGIRGFGYPLFAFGFLVWVVTTVTPTKLGSAVGWFWFCFATGLPTLGAVLARYMIPWIGSIYTLWVALGLVACGGLVALYGIKDKNGNAHASGAEKHVFRALFSSLSIAWERPKVGIGCIVRAVDTSAEFGFLVCLPIYFTRDLHFTLNQWLLVLQALALSNVIWNLLFGILSDKLSWRGTVMICGGFGSTITTLLLYWSPTYFGPSHMLPTLIVGALYGMTLAAYAPLSALMPYLAPDDKPAAMSLLNLGAGASVWVGPAIVYLVQPFFGVLGVMITFAIIYFISGIMTYFLTLDPEVQTEIDLAKKNRKQEA